MPKLNTTWNPLDKSNGFILDGANLKVSGNSLGYLMRSTHGKSSGKWYWEIKNNTDKSLSVFYVGVVPLTLPLNTDVRLNSSLYAMSGWTGGKSSTTSANGEPYAIGVGIGDVIGIKLDMDSKTIGFSINNIDYGISHSFTNSNLYPVVVGSSSSKSIDITANFGNTPFQYSIPQGYKAFIDDVKNKILISSNGSYQKFNPTTGLWEVVSTTTPTEQQYINSGMDSISSITSQQWKLLNASQPQVLYYTDDTAKTSANLEVLANYSPLDEIKSDFEVVTWTDNVNTTSKQVSINALPKEQFIKPLTSFKVAGDLKQIISNATASNTIDVGVIRYLISSDNGLSWESYKNNNWITVTPSNPSEIKSNGMTVEEINALTETQLSKYNDKNILVGIYLDEDVAKTQIAEVDDLSLKMLSATESPQINQASLYILNTTSTINVSYAANRLTGEISDLDSGKVQYRVLLNGIPYYPASGQFTNLMPSPLNLNITISNNDLLIDQQNTLKVEFQDAWGQTDFWETQFIGTYSGLLFQDSLGNYYSTDKGDILKYLDFGIIIAGQTTTEQEIVLKNTYGYDVNNIEITADKSNLPEGVQIQFGKTLSSFDNVESLYYSETLLNVQTLKFYVRLATQLGVTPSATGNFDIKVRADKV